MTSNPKYANTACFFYTWLIFIDLMVTDFVLSRLIDIRKISTKIFEVKIEGATYKYDII